MIRAIKSQRGIGRTFYDERTPFVQLAYYCNGRELRESSGTKDEARAWQMLMQKRGQVLAGNTPVDASKVKVDLLAALIEQDYTMRGLSTLREVKRMWRDHLSRKFGNMRAQKVTTDHVTAYMLMRQQEGVAKSTINNELSCLKRMFSLGREHSKLLQMPKFPKKLNCADNVREGFIENEEFYRLVESVEPWFHAICTCGRLLGWRHDELLKLRVKQVSLVAREIRLASGKTKSGKPRLVPLNDILFNVLAGMVHGKKPDDFVFTRPDGTAVKDMRDYWAQACRRAGLGDMYCRVCLMKSGELPPPLERDNRSLSIHSCDPRKGRLHMMALWMCPLCRKRRRLNEQSYRGKIFHDLRRTFARNMIEQGASEKVVMEIGGWETNSMMKRYQIVNQKNMLSAMNIQQERERAMLAARAEQELNESVASSKNTGNTRGLQDKQASKRRDGSLQ